VAFASARANSRYCSIRRIQPRQIAGWLATSSVITVRMVVPGRANRLHDGERLVLLAAFRFLAISP